MQRLRISIVLALVFVLGVMSALAQTSNGTIAGTVTDPSGAAITGATISAKSVQTGVTRSATTNNTGAYRLESLIPGTYVVTVTANGFSNTEFKNVQVTASVVTSINASVKLGSSETVNVEASAETLQTESGEISQTIGETEIHELPVANLNPYSLATTLPGVTTVTTDDFTNGTSYSVNGTRPRSNNFLIEGQDNNDAGIHGQGLQPENLDAIKEVTVLTNSYSAEFGHGGGSVANVIYKNGGNQFHGSAWDLLQNSALNATDHGDVLNGNPKTNSRENIFGFTVGGPIKKDKLFFFTSYQWDKYRASATGGTLVVPTAAGYSVLQAYSANPRIATLLSVIGNLRGNATPGLQGYNKFDLGLARGIVEVGPTARVGLGTQAESPEFDAKGDYLIGKNDTLNFRYIKSNYSTPYDFGNFPSQLPGFDTEQAGVSHNAGITYTHIFTPALVNEVRVSYGRIGFSFLPRPDTVNRPDGLGTAPDISITGLTGWGAPGGVPQGRFHNTYQAQDAVTWQKGKHFVKVGFDIADIRVVDQIPGNYQGSIAYGASTSGGAFSALANYMDDFGGKSTSVGKLFGNPIVRPEMVSQNYFFQDSWKVRTNLTLDLGVRYEYNGAPGNSLKYPAFDSNNPYPSCYGATYTCAPIAELPDKSNIAPRVGFAYTPHFLTSIFGENKTVIRGGFGVFYDGLFTNIVDNNQSGAPNAFAGSIVSSSVGRGTANWSTKINSVTANYSPYSTQVTMLQHLLSPETLQWNLNVQRELPGHFLAQVGYIGTRGEHLFAQDRLNPLDPNTGFYTNPNRGAIILRDNSGDSIYHGLQAELDRKFSKGLLLRASYTYSKAMDDESEVFTNGNWSTYPMQQDETGVSRKASDWGLSAFDHRQRLALTYVYDIPAFHQSDEFLFKGIRSVLKDWQISGETAFQSGNPANVEVGYDSNGDGISNDRPTLGNPLAPLATYAWDGASWFGTAPGTLCDGPSGWSTNNPCVPVAGSTVHWIVPAYGTNGNVKRNAIITPGTQVWNFALLRRIKLHEQHQVEFRTEMLNVFNHANTGTPNFSLTSGIPYNSGGTITPPSFGDYASTIGGGRQIRFWLKYSF